jgi:hypothetical protein
MTEPYDPKKPCQPNGHYHKFTWRDFDIDALTAESLGGEEQLERVREGRRIREQEEAAERAAKELAAQEEEAKVEKVRQLMMAEPIDRNIHNGSGSVRDTGSARDNAKTRRPRAVERQSKGVKIRGFGFIPNDPIQLTQLVGSSTLSAYQLLVRFASELGVTIRYAPGAPKANSNHLFLSPQKPTPLPGINYPDHFKVLRPLGLGSLVALIDGWKKKIYDTCNTIADRLATHSEGTWDGQIVEIPVGDSGMIKIAAPHWGDMGFSDKDEQDSGKKASKIRMKCQSALTRLIEKVELNKALDFIAAGQKVAELMEGTEEEAEKNSISLDGAKPLGSRWVPSLDWFDPKLSGITDEQLLPLLSESEREVFMTMLGRALLGKKGTLLNTKQGMSQQQQLWRLYSIWEGRVGGLGRSTTMGYLVEGFRYLGYSADAMDDPTGRFSQGKSCALDFGYLDDLSDDGTINVMSSGIFKTLTSGGTLKVEEKGQPSYTATAQGVFCICTNKIDPARLSGLDAGNLSRAAAMRNRTGRDQESKKFAETYGYPVNVDRGYYHLAQTYEIDIQTLTLLLLARSADKFREYAGKTDLSMVDHLNQLRKGFRLDIDQDFCLGVLQSYAELTQLADPRTVGLGWFDIRKYLQLLEEATNEGHRIPGCADPTDLLKTYAVESKKGRRGLSRVCEEFFSCLLSENGFSYPTEISYWSDRWSEFRDGYDWDVNYQRYSRVASARPNELSKEDQELQVRLDRYRNAGVK